MLPRKVGFTLIELLIVISIIGLLIILTLVNWKRQIARAHDSQRKTDLTKIARAFEEYYNDHECYPDQSVLNICGGNALSPYLAKVPCDPVRVVPYNYVPLDAGNLCIGYKMFAILEDTSDNDIARVGCSGAGGCGVGGGYNYGISSGGNVVGSSYASLPTPTPTPAPVGPFGCSPGGTCNSYSPVQAAVAKCPIMFFASNCDNACSDPLKQCQL